ncbi:MAG: hypothetical protein ACMG6S_03450 [Byssovorax sp.]
MSLAVCNEAIRGLEAARDELTKAGVAPDDDTDRSFRALGNTFLCLGKAGDCAGARKAYPGSPAAFDRELPQCKGK